MRLTLLFALALVACKDDGSSTTDSGIPPADSGADPDNDGHRGPASFSVPPSGHRRHFPNNPPGPQSRRGSRVSRKHIPNGKRCLHSE